MAIQLYILLHALAIVAIEGPGLKGVKSTSALLQIVNAHAHVSRARNTIGQYIAMGDMYTFKLNYKYTCAQVVINQLQ